MSKDPFDTHRCECESHGFCDKFKTNMPVGFHNYCSRVSGDSEKQDKYIRYFYAQKELSKGIESGSIFRNQMGTPCVYMGPIISKTDSSGMRCNCPRKWLRKCELKTECVLSVGTGRSTQACVECCDYDAS